MPEAWLSHLPWPEMRLLLTVLAVFLVLSLVSRAVLRVFERLTRPVLFLRELLQRVRRPLYLLLPLLGVQTVLSSAPDDLLFIEPLRRLTSLVLIGTFTWLGLRAVDAVQQVILLRHPVDIADNLQARRIQTQTRVLVRTLSFFVVLFGVACMLMTFPTARQLGTSLLASAGVAGLAVGFAAKPVLGNLIAGLQIALTQPIRLDDVVIVQGEWGRIEEITGTYVVVRIWDDRRLVVPLQWFIENPFQNWTRVGASITGAVIIWVDYALPLEPLRRELDRLCGEQPKLWDGRVSVLQVVEATDRAMQLRVLVSSADSSRNWDLRCYLRENLISFVNRNYPDSLPRMRAELRSLQPPQAPATGDGHIAGPIAGPERQPPV